MFGFAFSAAFVAAKFIGSNNGKDGDAECKWKKSNEDLRWRRQMLRGMSDLESN
jgi:hypothetical protein